MVLRILCRIGDYSEIALILAANIPLSMNYPVAETTGYQRLKRRKLISSGFLPCSLIYFMTISQFPASPIVAT